MVNYTLIKEMFKLQDTFNEYTVTDWKNQNLPWHRAIWLECAEAVESLDWKWWKHQEPDYDNVKVELVDIWHFLMSHYIVYFPDVVENPEAYHQLFEVNPTQVESVELIDMIEDLSGLILEDPSETQVYSIFIFVNAWAKLGYDINELYNEYVIKNVLNKFRQDNGYKTGDYVKMWHFENELVEDNVVTWSLADTVENKENLFNELYELLDGFYSSMPKTKVC